MATARMMFSRLWELHSKEIIVFGGLIVMVACFAISTTLGVIAFYALCIVGALVAWERDLPPFSWLKKMSLKVALVVVAPLTVIATVIGVLIWVLFAPFFWWRGIQKDRQERLEKYDEYLPPSRVRNWLIGVPVYYVCLAGLLFGVWTLVNSS